jgi:hypothetical protein
VPRFKAGDGEGVERFKREARAAATLQHPNLCPIFDVGEINGRSYLTMGYIEGRSLAELIQGGEPLPERPVADLVRKLALALEEAHRKGVVHRDLKPANIMITERHDPVILDFGLARQVNKEDLRLTAPGMLLGTPAYMPPEQVRGDTQAMGPACDIYSLGVVLYEMLTGKLPFQGANLGALIGQVLIEEPPPPSLLRTQIDKTLEAICLKAMAKDPSRRFHSMTEFAAALGAFLGNEAPPHPGLTGSTARMDVPAVPPNEGLATQLIAQLLQRLEASEARARPRPLWPWLASGAASVLAGILVWVVFFRPQPEQQPPQIIVVHLHIANLDDSVKFVLIGDKRIPVGKLDEPLSLPAGSYSIKLEHDDGRTVELPEVALSKEDDNKTIEEKKEASDWRIDVVKRPVPSKTDTIVDRRKDSKTNGKKEPDLPPVPLPINERRLPSSALILVDAPAQYDNATFAARHLVAPPGKGEYSAPGNGPIAVVVGFPQGRLAEIGALGVNPTSRDAENNWVREVDFEVSDTYPFTGFRKVDTLKLKAVPNDAILSLKEPITARYVRFNFMTNGGGNFIELNKVLVLGKLVRDSKAPPMPLVNVALAKNGGKIKHVTSEYDRYWAAANLIDGNPGGGWSSKADDNSPSVTIELGRDAVVRHVVINPYTNKDPSNNAAAEVDVLLSETENDFRSIGKLEMKPIGRDWSLDLKAPTRARYVKIRFLRNGKGNFMQAHEIKVFAEAEADDLEARVAALFDADVQSRIKAAQVLKNSGDRRAVPALVERVTDENADSPGIGDKSVALAALHALAPEAVGDALTEACRTNESPKIRVWAAQHMIRYKDAFSQEDRAQASELLAERVVDNHPDAPAIGDKTAALSALKALGPDRVGKALLASWRANKSARILVWVASHLGEERELLSAADHKQAVDLLSERVADYQTDGIAYSDKTAALRTLRLLDAERAKAALQRAKQSSNPAIVRWANRQ